MNTNMNLCISTKTASNIDILWQWLLFKLNFDFFVATHINNVQNTRCYNAMTDHTQHWKKYTNSAVILIFTFGRDHQQRNLWHNWSRCYRADGLQVTQTIVQINWTELKAPTPTRNYQPLDSSFPDPSKDSSGKGWNTHLCWLSRD